MTARILAFPGANTDVRTALAARRAYREGVREIAARAVAAAFSESFRIPGAGALDVEDASALFVAAMRRELRKSGIF